MACRSLNVLCCILCRQLRARFCFKIEDEYILLLTTSMTCQCLSSSITLDKVLKYWLRRNKHHGIVKARERTLEISSVFYSRLHTLIIFFWHLSFYWQFIQYAYPIFMCAKGKVKISIKKSVFTSSDDFNYRCQCLII